MLLNRSCLVYEAESSLFDFQPSGHYIAEVFHQYTSPPSHKIALKILRPSRLRRGDVIGIVAPASAPSDPRKIDKGVRYLERLGYCVKLGRHVKRLHGYLAGTDEQRLNDLHEMFADKRVKAIIAVRGGYGTPRLLRKVNYPLIKRNPKILVGYSDLTALQLAIFKKTGLITFSGPMLALEIFKNFDPFTEEFFWQLLTSPHPIGKLENPQGHNLKILHGGEASGILLGGNLSMIVSLLGTPLLPEFKNSILFFEEVGEEPYRLDRMLTQLRNADILRKIRGLVIGDLTSCVPADPSKPTLKLDEIIKELTAGLQIPIITNVPYGHIPRKFTLPIGLKVRFNARREVLEFPEGAVV